LLEVVAIGRKNAGKDTNNYYVKKTKVLQSLIKHIYHF
jgi:hypothetical protein